MNRKLDILALTVISAELILNQGEIFSDKSHFKQIKYYSLYITKYKYENFFSSFVDQEMHKGYKIAIVAAVIGMICLAVVIIVPSHHVKTDYNAYLGKTQEHKEPNLVWLGAAMIMIFAFLTALLAALLTAVAGKDVRESPETEELPGKDFREPPTAEDSAENASEKIVCPSCGKTISRDSNFCTYCGRKAELAEKGSHPRGLRKAFLKYQYLRCE